MKQLLERKHATRIIVLALLLAMLVWLAPMDWQVAKAADGNVEKISVTGGGSLLFDKGTGTITGYEGNITNVTIPETYDGAEVTCIAYQAFRLCDSLTSVTIPNSVTTIGDGAFNACGNLASITIPNGVTTIGDYAFFSCGSLASVTISGSVTAIGGDAFGDCGKLSAITVDGNNQKYSDQSGVLFNKGKTELIQYPAGSNATSYVIPDSVTAIGNPAFFRCTNLASVTIPDSVTTIGHQAFFDCRSLTGINIPASVTEIGVFVFGDCGKLSAITVDGNNQKYSSDQGVLFNKNKIELIQYPAGNNATSYVIPAGVTTIGQGAFDACRNLASVTIPDGMTSIEWSAFSDCINLASVTIPGSVTSIDVHAFENCTSLTSVTIPDSVTSIDKEAFGYYWNDTGEYVKVPNFKIYGYSNGSAAAKYARDNGFEYISLGSEGINLDDNGNKDDNAQSNNGSNDNDQGDKGGNPGNKTDNGHTNVPASPTKSTPTAAPTQPKPGSTVKDKKSNGSYVVTQAKQNGGTATYKKPLDKKKTSVTIPATVEIGGETYKVTAIEKNAFKGNKNLKTVKIGANVEKIGANAFNECTKLKTVKIPKKVKAIQKGAFAGCKNLKSITIQTKKLTKKNVEAKAFKGIHKKAIVKTPKGKAKAYAKLLRSKGLGKGAKVK